MEFVLRGYGTGFVRLVGFLVMKVFAIAASIANLFPIYWVLPNGKVPARAVLPAAIIMGLLSEALKYCLHPRAAMAEFSGSVRALRSVGEHDVLGFPIGTAAAGGR